MCEEPGLGRPGLLLVSIIAWASVVYSVKWGHNVDSQQRVLLSCLAQLCCRTFLLCHPPPPPVCPQIPLYKMIPSDRQMVFKPGGGCTGTRFVVLSGVCVRQVDFHWSGLIHNKKRTPSRKCRGQRGLSGHGSWEVVRPTPVGVPQRYLPATCPPSRWRALMSSCGSQPAPLEEAGPCAGSFRAVGPVVPRVLRFSVKGCVGGRQGACSQACCFSLLQNRTGG